MLNFPTHNHLPLAIGLCIAILVGACQSTKPVVQTAPPKPVLLTLGNKTFTTDEFFESFTKNQLSDDTTQRTGLNEYVDLYTNLKLKVIAAENEGRDTTEAFREEMATYRKQLAQSYLMDKTLVEQLATEAYQRMQQDVSASHILLAVSEDAAPADTLAVYKKALDLLTQLRKGDDFAALAKQYSNDQSTQQNGGNMGYFTAFQMVYPLENAAYTTPIGQVSEPVRTRYGYHLIRVNDRRPSRGKIQVAHIMVRISPSADAAGQTIAKARIDEAYTHLQANEPFEAVCRQYSDDSQSKNNGGLLPAFATGQMVPAFEEAAYALTTPGSYSTPVRTNYGWHIIRLVTRKPMETYLELAPALRQKVVTDTRGDVLRQLTIARLRREYGVKTDINLLQTVLATADSSLIQGRWRNSALPDPSVAAKVLLTIQNKSLPVGQFLDYVRQKQQPGRARSVGADPATAMQRLYNRFVGDQLLAVEEDNLERKYPDFRSLLTEIRDGVLLSQVMEKQVWERSLADSTGQRQYFERHRDKYRYPERNVATVVQAQDAATLQQAQQLLAQSPYQLRRSASDLAFDKNQTVLTAKQRETLFEVLVAMTKNPDYIIEVAGSRSTDEADTTADGRIQTVVNYLTRNGVPLARIMEKNYEAFRPGPKTAPELRRLTFQYFSTSKQDVAKVLNTKHANALTITEGVFAKGDNPAIDALSDRKPGTSTVPLGTGIAQITIIRVEPPRLRTFDEARGAVINDYQAELESRWISSLRQQYPVKVNEEEVKKLKK